MPGGALHRRIAADIRRRIDAGEWLPGDRLPSRVGLGREYGVHEQTIRLAVIRLRSDGILEGEARRRLTVAYRPAMRVLADPDAPWPHGTETTDTEPQRATVELAERLGVPIGTLLQHEAVECWDPGGHSAMLVTTWWQGRQRKHESAVVEVNTVRLSSEQAHALGLTVDTVAYLLVRTRLDGVGRPVETADLILPMDRWVLRFLL
jgi:GntR family transcriptional regulator